jgi:serine O-acetyltransferase
MYAVIYGDIEIADNCYIGANAVVNKSFIEFNSVIAGVPAKVVKVDPINWWVKNGLKFEE